MAKSLSKIHDFIDDLKTSWYFRVWVLMWLVCAVTAFVALILFAQNLNEANAHEFQRIYFENKGSLNFPQFHFRVSNFSINEYALTAVGCTHNNKSLNIMGCQKGMGYGNMSQCQAVDASHIKVKADDNSLPNWDQRVVCDITAVGNISPADMSIAWELDNEPKETYAGPNSYASIWIQPFTSSWVLISQLNKDGQTQWQRSLVYHDYTDPSNSIAIWKVETIIDSFRVFNIESRQNAAPGWFAPAGAGGFAFFTLILHAIVMFLVNFLLPNNSKFLLGSSVAQAASYQQL